MPVLGPLTRVDDVSSADEPGETPGTQAPPLFVRAISTRPAAPWDQNRAARLEAELNAPLPLDVTALVVKRLERWSPGAPGRYAAVYARRSDVADGLTTVAQLDGRPIPVRFLSPERQAAQLKTFAVAVAGATIMTFLLVLTIASVIAVRSEAEARLEALEQTVQRRLVEARRREALAEQSRALTAAGVENLRASAVLADLDWAARAKSADVSLEGVYREGALMAVEVRGDQVPFAGGDRAVQRSEKPVRSGVWLWGVTDAAEASR